MGQGLSSNERDEPPQSSLWMSNSNTASPSGSFYCCRANLIIHMQQGAMPALCLIPQRRGPSQVLRYGGSHTSDDFSDDLESRKVTDRQGRGDRWGRVQGNRQHVQPPLKVTNHLRVEKRLYVTFLVTRLPSSSIKCSSVIDSTGTFLAWSPC
jgi:hypothetical protein